MAAGEWSAAHRRRLREVWRSAGWPCHDALEIDLLAAGLLLRRHDAQGRETLWVGDAGIQVLAEGRRRAQAAFDAHELLVSRVATEMQRAGRIVWRGLRLRAPLPRPDAGPRWVIAMPDVFSIRHTTVEAYVEPVVHEIKVRRADLLADLRHRDKGEAYRALCSQCWYVLRSGIADADEVPQPYGVMFADAAGLSVARPAPQRGATLPFAVWMALARAHAEAADDEPWQDGLADVDAQAEAEPGALRNDTAGRQDHASGVGLAPPGPMTRDR